MPNELELKLALIPKMAQKLLLEGLPNGMRFEPGLQLSNTYFDTPDQALKSAKMALRIRRIGDTWIQTLKSEGCSSLGGMTQRGEWESVLDSDRLDVAIVKERLPPEIDLATLQPVFSTDFIRHIARVSRADACVEIALDLGEVIAGQRRAPISELELELKSGSADVLLELASDIAKKIAVRMGVKSKAARAQALLNTAQSNSLIAQDAISPLSKPSASIVESELNRICLDAVRTAGLAYEAALENALECVFEEIPMNTSVTSSAIIEAKVHSRYTFRQFIELRTALLQLISVLGLVGAPESLVSGFANLLAKIAMLADLPEQFNGPNNMQRVIQPVQLEQLSNLQTTTELGLLSLALARWLNERLAAELQSKVKTRSLND